MENRGGLSAVWNDRRIHLPLPVGGIMTDQDAYQTAAKYELLDRSAKELGSALTAPFMTLSFLALLVIPRLKLSDRGLFDGDNFRFVDLFAL
ncbi:MAG: adenine deaminase C-terminal domain-containing protein, partial [Smithellaceae bacterium]|nr:adenine deaminase C-terminal domain-containing protein [Smithellaceae bacterium]